MLWPRLFTLSSNRLHILIVLIIELMIASGHREQAETEPMGQHFRHPYLALGRQSRAASCAIFYGSAA